MSEGKQAKMIEPKNPNNNCLEGMQCPECDNYGPFYIEVTVTACMSDDGTDDLGDQYWDDESHCMCSNYKCGFSSSVSHFKK